MNVRWTATARRHLRAIREYIAKDSEYYAQRVIGRIIDRSEQIAEFPMSGREVPEYSRGHVRELFEPPYRIIYRIKRDAIDVIAVVHGARNWRPKG